jgi:hypothetical protein
MRFVSLSVAAVALLALSTASASACHRGHRHHGCATSCCAQATPCCQASPCGQVRPVAASCGCGSYSHANYAPVVSGTVTVGNPAALPPVALYAPAR